MPVGDKIPSAKPDYWVLALSVLLAIAAIALLFWLLSLNYGPCPEGWQEHKMSNGVECINPRPTK